MHYKMHKLTVQLSSTQYICNSLFYVHFSLRMHSTPAVLSVSLLYKINCSETHWAWLIFSPLMLIAFNSLIQVKWNMVFAIRFTRCEQNSQKPNAVYKTKLIFCCKKYLKWIGLISTTWWKFSIFLGFRLIVSFGDFSVRYKYSMLLIWYDLILLYIYIFYEQTNFYLCK